MFTKVINIRYAPPGWEGNPKFVYIGRAGRGHDGFFGNPFPLRQGEARGSTIERFRAYALDRIDKDPTYARAVMALHGKTLVCFCKPEPCHGDVLAHIADLNPLALLARPLSPLAEAEIAAGEHEADHGGYDSNCGICEELQEAIWREFRAVNA